MAEEVQISNVGGDGVASEVTLLALLAAMEKMGGSKGKGGAAAKVQELHNKSVTAGTTTTNKNTAATSNATAATAKATEATGKFAKSIAGATSVALGKLLGSVGGLTNELLGSEESISAFARHIPLVGGYLGTLTGMIDENINNFRSLSQVGAVFGDGLNDIRATAARAGIPLGEFTTLVSQNSERMKFFGGSVASGATNFANMSKQLRDGPGKRFLALGYTAQELNESLIDYAEFSQTQVTKQGQQNRMSAAGAAAYLETIDQLAAVTGKRRDQIKEEMNAAMGDQRNRLAMAAMSEKERTQFTANLAQTPQAFQDVITDMADGIANSPASQGLMTLSDTFREQAANIKNMDATQYNNFLVKVREELDAKGQAMGAGAQAIIASGGAVGEALAMTSALADKRNITEEQRIANETARLKQAEKDDALLGFSNAVRDIRTGLMDAFVTSGVLKTIQDAFNDLAKIIGTPEFAAGLKAGVEMLLDGVKLAAGAVKSVFTFLSDIGDTFGAAGVIAAVVAGIATLFAAKAVVGALASKVGGAVKEKALSAVGLGSTSPGTTAGKKGSAGKGAGDALGNIGKGLGKGLGGILKGLAGGISAFANPTVALGAAGLAAAIVLIGGAIAGATWMVGASLPKMAEGLKSFETLDGQKLIDAGKGMGAIALGMAAFGAGSAVAGLGSLVGGITQGLVSMFGGDDPLTKMLKFQEYNFDRTRIENNAASMVAYSKGMAALGGAQAVSGIGAAVSAVGSGIAALFGAENPLSGLIKFQGYTFDTAKIQANGLAVKAYAEAIKDFPQSPTASLMSSFRTGVASLLGGETDPMAPIKRFGDMTLNTNGIIANAGAVAAYAEAIKDFPASPSASVFTAAKDAIIGLLGGKTDPMAPIKRFGDLTLNTAGIIANAGAVAAYAVAMKDFPNSPSASVFTAAKDAIIGLLGGKTDPFAPMKAFGDLTFNTAGIVNNAGAVSAFATAMQNMPTIDATRTGGVLGAIAGWFAGNEQMPWDSVKAFGDAEINAAGVTANAEAINAMSTSLNNFSIEKLDTTGIISYTNAMENLVEVLGELNQELSKDNNGRSAGTGENAGSVMSKVQSVGGGGETNDQLNNIMNQVLMVLNEIRDLDEDVERNTRNIIGSNLAQGGVSNVRR